MEIKRFYSVTYRVWGANAPETAWFNSEEKANEFYDNRDYVDMPVMHQARTKETIKKYEALCNLYI